MGIPGLNAHVTASFTCILHISINIETVYVVNNT